MVVSKGAIVVWMLIVLMAVGGYSVLSRVTIPNSAVVTEGAVQPAAVAAPKAVATESPQLTLPTLPSAKAPAAAVPDFSAVEIPNIDDLTSDAAPVPVERSAPGNTLYVIADMLNIRSTPSTDGEILQKVKLGFAVQPKQRSGDWVGFDMRDGSTGWLRTDFLSDEKPREAEAAPAPVSNEPLQLQ
jgi:uncharacterized protein YgiM (DUF1202 family)